MSNRNLPYRTEGFNGDSTPQSGPTCLEQLLPVALTHTFGKLLEGNVASLSLADMRHLIDHQQLDNLKGHSTTLYMVCLLDAVLKALE